jgi:hypothetical protein
MRYWGIFTKKDKLKVYKDPDCNEGYPMVFISKNQAVDECCEEKEGVHEVEIIKKHKGGKK